MRRTNGFTLIELLIVVAILAVLAAIALPALMRARMSGNEASAIASLRAISSGEVNYATTCAQGGYATDLTDLVKPAPPSNHAFLSPDLGFNGVEKSGYIFFIEKNAKPGSVDVLLPTCNGAANPRATSFYASAVPINYGVTGARYLATDTPGTIFYDNAAAIPNPIPAGTLAIN